ncbi:hypothetical protein BU197_21375 [Streptomyces sp. CBMA291]|nr:hypothetical protein [Streptomyces sp. CBMA291]MBD0717753.1 hypothetical protein [Streptomyces sp. CBMA370]
MFGGGRLPGGGLLETDLPVAVDVLPLVALRRVVRPRPEPGFVRGEGGGLQVLAGVVGHGPPHGGARGGGGRGVRGESRRKGPGHGRGVGDHGPTALRAAGADGHEPDPGEERREHLPAGRPAGPPGQHHAGGGHEKETEDDEPGPPPPAVTGGRGDGGGGGGGGGGGPWT